jgi:rhodanese-related sulfurtransferase
MSIPGGVMVDAAKAKALHDKGALFVDARVAAEYAEKHIKGAISVVFKEVHKKVAKLDPKDEFDLSKLPADKSKAMVFYCNGSPCWRGYKAADAAIKGGYKNVNWFRDGLPAWEARSYPTE